MPGRDAASSKFIQFSALWVSRLPDGHASRFAHPDMIAPCQETNSPPSIICHNGYAFFDISKRKQGRSTVTT
ncbi:hypothetical protein, partial [Desulfoluna sp.]|uniref:hypothetical protein n=1 Tax=Desulfoluna sp. TaxID=2045199 RepID=UPI002601A38E